VRDYDAFAARARALFAGLPEEERAGLALEVRLAVEPHPARPGEVVLADRATGPGEAPAGPLRATVRLHHGSFLVRAEAESGFDPGAALERALVREAEGHREDLEACALLPTEDALFEAHARFRSGDDTPAGWYRRGEPVAPGLWAVDLDLFLELPLSGTAWATLPGRRLALRILGDDFEAVLPADVAADEIWTFAGGGLEDAPLDDGEGAEGDEDHGSDEDAPPGLVGDLHVIPVLE
jgi:hypothetical protein